MQKVPINLSFRTKLTLRSAGVTGLTSSIFLAEDGYQVTVIASHVPGDESIEYTSPW
jgi:D-amino-acid oxidase